MNSSSPVKVLLVDDETDFLAATARALERRGFAVTAAASAEQARAALVNDDTIDVAVLDVRLPDGDGHDLFLELKARYPRLQAIILTGNRDEHKSFTLSHRGLYDYLDKPCEVEQLARVIMEAHQRGLEDRDQEAPVEDAGAGAIRVLLIDDEVDFLKSLARLLARRGMTVFSAENGEDGLALLRREQVDVAVVDLKMPGLTGLEVLERINRERPRVQVIILTGHATVESGVEGMKKGAADYLFKPQDPEDLIRKIQYAAARAGRDPEKKRKWWRRR